MANEDKRETPDNPTPSGGGAPQGDAGHEAPSAAGRSDDDLAAARDAARREAIADAEQEAARLAAEAGETPPPAEAPTDEAPATSTSELETQVADLTDRLLRAHAEIQNLHRRLERDVAESQKYGITKFARDIVSMTDNFERALSSVSPDARENNPALASLLDGVRMIEKEFQTVLSKHGVKRLDPANAPFDPHKHQAVMERDDKSVPSGTVIQVFQAGYEIDDRVLRPAMVVVAKGGAKPVKEPKPDRAPGSGASQSDDTTTGDNEAKGTESNGDAAA